MKKSFAILCGILLCAVALAQSSEDGKALYLTELNEPSLKARVLRDTPLNLTRASNTTMTFLPRGQVVEVLAIAQYQLQVRGRMRTGAVQGWVIRSDITPIAEETISEISQKIQNQKKLEDAIKRKEIIFGMTQEQVRMILGKPVDKSSIREEDGATEIWTYYSYKTVPVTETYGYGTNIYTQTFMQKVRTGSKTISFRDGKVVRIEQKTEQVRPQGLTPYP